MKRVVFILLLSVLLLNGCATFETFRYTQGGIYSPTNPSNVKILYSSPQDEHIVIGEVIGRDTGLDFEENVINQFRHEAAKIGGDAIILISDKEYVEKTIEPAYTETYRQTYHPRIITTGPSAKTIFYPEKKMVVSDLLLGT